MNRFFRTRQYFHLAILLSFFFISCGKSSHPMTAQSLSLATPDGTLAITLYPPLPMEKKTNPGIILLPAFSTESEPWSIFLDKAQRCGITCIALQPGAWFNLKHPADYSKEEVDQVCRIIDISFQQLIEKGVNPQNIGIMGADIWANIGLEYTTRHSAIQALVMLSPGLEYKGIRTEYLMKSLGKRPTMLLASQGDSYASTSCITLKKLSAGLCETQQYTGTAHGIDILYTMPASNDQILLWLSDILGSLTP